jgi:hypothetical protein
VAHVSPAVAVIEKSVVVEYCSLPGAAPGPCQMAHICLGHAAIVVSHVSGFDTPVVAEGIVSGRRRGECYTRSVAAEAGHVPEWHTPSVAAAGHSLAYHIRVSVDSEHARAARLDRLSAEAGDLASHSHMASAAVGELFLASRSESVLRQLWDRSATASS